jgi:hypothetical protein
MLPRSMAASCMRKVGAEGIWRSSGWCAPNMPWLCHRVDAIAQTQHVSELLPVSRLPQGFWLVLVVQFGISPSCDSNPQFEVMSIVLGVGMIPDSSVVSVPKYYSVCSSAECGQRCVFSQGSFLTHATPAAVSTLRKPPTAAQVVQVSI